MSRRRPTVFVIMPFAEEYDAGLRDVIRPAIEKAGMLYHRADLDPQGYIHEQMFEGIFDLPVAIADLSGINPNVFYELGISHCAGRKTIMVAREDFIDLVPFDLKPYRVLVYPKPPVDSEGHTGRDDYHARVNQTVEKLAVELARAVEPNSDGISNPVQDFLALRSPLTCGESRYLEGFSGAWEEDLPKYADHRLTYLSLSGSHFAGMLSAYADSGRRQAPLHVEFLLLDPTDREGWSFVYRLREGRPVTEEEIDKFTAQDRMLQERTEQVIHRLERNPHLSGEVRYYRGVPLYWAYRIDQTRIITGHLAAGRLSSRNLPVSVIVKDDPRTSVLYSYYSSSIDVLIDS
ncbi:MAG: hypothetical protein ABIF09_08180 [Gemmatimonadota bacterium]